MQTQAHPLALTSAECQARRLALGLSRPELARLALVDTTTVARFEAGGTVTSLTRRRIAAALEQAQEAAA